MQGFFDKKLGKKIKFSAYFKQSLLASLFLLIFLLIWHQFIAIPTQILFSAIASSIFLTFVSTNIYHDLSNKIIGGQIIGVIVGVALWHSKSYLGLIFPNLIIELLIIFVALSVGFSLLIMAVVDFEHPPAAGTAMAFTALAVAPKFSDALFIIIAASLLAITHYLLKKYNLLKNLN